MNAPETAAEAYARGYEMGMVAIRLDHHDDQIKATNALLGKTVEITQTMASTMQTLTEARVTDAATRVATADAVKEAKLAQEAQASSAWSPASRLIAMIGATVGAVAIVWSILSSLPGA